MGLLARWLSPRRMPVSKKTHALFKSPQLKLSPCHCVTFDHSASLVICCRTPARQNMRLLRRPQRGSCRSCGTSSEPLRWRRQACGAMQRLCSMPASRRRLQRRAWQPPGSCSKLRPPQLPQPLPRLRCAAALHRCLGPAHFSLYVAPVCLLPSVHLPVLAICGYISGPPAGRLFDSLHVHRRLFWHTGS